MRSILCDAMRRLSRSRFAFLVTVGLFAMLPSSVGAQTLSSHLFPATPTSVGVAPVNRTNAAGEIHPWIRIAPDNVNVEPAPPSSGHEGWQFSFAPYGFLSSINGELRARDRVVEVDRSFGDITNVLKFAAGVRLEAQSEKWGLSFDNNYVKVGDDVTTARGVIPDFRFDLTLNVTELESTYRLWSSGDQDEPVGGPRFAIDALGGVRFAHISEDLEVRRLIAPDVARDGSSTYVHGYVGNRVVISPSKYVSLTGRYNIALASDFSWFVNGSVEVRPWEHLAFGGGLQVLDLSLEKDDTDAALDARFAGPILFVKFHF